MPDSSIQPELLSLREKLVDEVEKDEKERDGIQNRIDKNKALLHAINNSLGAIGKEATGYGAVAATLRTVIKGLDRNQFTPTDVERALRTQFPTAPFTKESIRTTLWNLAKRKEINHIRPGTNLEPALYGKITGSDSEPTKISKTKQSNGQEPHTPLRRETVAA